MFVCCVYYQWKLIFVIRNCKEVFVNILVKHRCKKCIVFRIDVWKFSIMAKFHLTCSIISYYHVIRTGSSIDNYWIISCVLYLTGTVRFAYFKYNCVIALLKNHRIFKHITYECLLFNLIIVWINISFKKIYIAVLCTNVLWQRKLNFHCIFVYWVIVVIIILIIYKYSCKRLTGISSHDISQVSHFRVKINIWILEQFNRIFWCCLISVINIEYNS